MMLLASYTYIPVGFLDIPHNSMMLWSPMSRTSKRLCYKIILSKCRVHNPTPGRVTNQVDDKISTIGKKRDSLVNHVSTMSQCEQY
uniref:Uncharacterized protein n=1 Tax=Romanomermis culicivorax TaxID=13658 RepID=A0A915HUK0_ROMCU